MKGAKNMITVKTYGSFNPRRYGNPWIARVDETGRINFKSAVGSYTGRYGAGEAGDLYLYAPVEGQIYAYGQKDYRGSNTAKEYVQYIDGKLVPVATTELVQALNTMAGEGAKGE
ncbi:hypothetical protein [Allofournierella sp.]|uniref:hypothetical protein n=2 Tax=Allofournierella sp. TaxID=1940256 RepID=UPI0020569174|nr:MAG TPA: hypothetical protein [Caudoviricetes sp.]